MANLSIYFISIIPHKRLRHLLWSRIPGMEFKKCLHCNGLGIVDLIDSDRQIIDREDCVRCLGEGQYPDVWKYIKNHKK